MGKPPSQRAGSKVRHKYQVVASDILRRIQSGEWKLGAKIPSIDELEEGYPYSRMTIFKAIQTLEQQGYLRVAQGIGTFVARNRPTGCVGLVIEEEALHPQKAPFAFLLSRELRHFFVRLGYSLKLYIESCESVSEVEIPVEELLGDLRQGKLCGLVATSCNTPLCLQTSPTWAKKKIPYVDITGHEQVPFGGKMMFDTASMVRIALEACLRNSRRSLAIIGNCDIESLRQEAGRLEIETRQEWIQPFGESHGAGFNHEKAGYQAMLALWDAGEKPEAVLVTDDIVAKGVALAIVQLGIVVPRDLLFVAMANSGSGISYPVAAVTAEYDVAECARLAGEMLLDLMRDPTITPRVEILRPALRMEDALAYVG